jgi:hypothetical protein
VPAVGDGYRAAFRPSEYGRALPGLGLRARGRREERRLRGTGSTRGSSSLGCSLGVGGGPKVGSACPRAGDHHLGGTSFPHALAEPASCQAAAD